MIVHQSKDDRDLDLTCVVTGAAGFIGSHLVDALLAQGRCVVGVDDFDPWYDPERKHDNLAAAGSNPDFRLVELDVMDARFSEVVAGAEVVYHLAGRPGVQDSWGGGFAETSTRNVSASQSVFEASLNSGVGRVVYASSSSIYGSASSQRSRDPAPISPYGASKLAGEILAAVYRARGLVVTVLRYFTVYGPRQRPDMAMHRLFDAARPGGRTFERRGDGTQQREFTFVGDVVDATIAAGERADAANQTLDVGGGSVVALNDVVAEIESICGNEVRLRSLSRPPGDPEATEADLAPAETVLRWQPHVGLNEGLVAQWQWQCQTDTYSGASSTSA